MTELRRPNEHSDEHSYLDLLLFRLDQELYAVSSSSVREVIRYHSFTPVPGAPPSLPGIISQRGLILPVVEPHSILGLNPLVMTQAARMVIIMHNDVGLALLVEAVLDLISVPMSTLELVPNVLDPTRARFLQGILQSDNGIIGLLDLDELIAGLREKQ